MLRLLQRIAFDYASPEELREIDTGLSDYEYLEMAYENMQAEAEHLVKKIVKET